MFVSPSLDVDSAQTSPQMAQLWPTSTSLDGYFDYENQSLPNSTLLAAPDSSLSDMDDILLLVRNFFSADTMYIFNTHKDSSANGRQRSR
jgi:hypothetical protein